MLNDGYSKDPARRNIGGLYKGNQRHTGASSLSTSDSAEALIEIKSRARAQSTLGKGISATALEPFHKRPRVFQGERFCPDCGTRLNKYNKGPFCGPHTPIKTPRVRGNNKQTPKVEAMKFVDLSNRPSKEEDI